MSEQEVAVEPHGNTDAAWSDVALMDAGGAGDKRAERAFDAALGAIGETGLGASETGVLASVKRDEKGRLLPGHNLGRPRKERTIIAALKAFYTPELIIQRLEDTYAIAESTRSWRGMLESTRTAIEYIDGKPKQMQHVVRSTGQQWLELLRTARLADDGNTGENA